MKRNMEVLKMAKVIESVNESTIVALDRECEAGAVIAYSLYDSLGADDADELPADAVIVETMPDHLRSSHRAAGNWGQYPHNGASRQIMSRFDAGELVAADGDEYDRIVRDATAADLANYEVAS